MVKRVAGVLAGVAMVSEGMRVSKQGSAGSGKTLGGVPVLNYQTAYGGKARASAGEKEHWMVFAKKGVTTKTLEDLCKSSGACEKTGHPSEGGVPFFEVYTTEEGLEKVLSEAQGAVDFVEPDGTFELDDPASDLTPERASWGLGRVGADSRPNEGAGTHIYIFDTGIRVSHTDFGGRAITTLDCTTGNSCAPCNGDASCGGDVQGHGTHCAGTAGGTSYGVAPSATLHAVKVLSDSGSGDFSWSIDSLDWMGDNGESRSVASMSLGGRGIVNGMAVAIDAAVANGIVVSVAGGNSNMDACSFSPAFVPSAITVGSTAADDSRSWFSNFGSCTNIWAPGSDITSAGVDSDSASDTQSGTSMACPHVSGGAALLLASGTGSGQILSTLQDNAQQNVITGLRDGDTNLLLNVGR